MGYYYQQTFPHLPPALLPPRNSLLKNQEKERLKKAAEANLQDQIIHLQDLIQKIEAAPITGINYMLDQEAAVIITQETASNM